MDKLEKHFKALANIRRIRLLNFLSAKGEVKLDFVVQKFRLPYKTVFRNLSILRTAGFLESRIYKGAVYFKISDNLSETAESLLNLINQD